MNDGIILREAKQAAFLLMLIPDQPQLPRFNIPGSFVQVNCA
jgi:hypothetical protein